MCILILHSHARAPRGADVHARVCVELHPRSIGSLPHAALTRTWALHDCNSYGRAAPVCAPGTR